MYTNNIFGVINTLFIMFSVYGLVLQLQTIWHRKASTRCNVSPTAVLSLNQFSVSYFAYLAFFIYGYSIEPFNHYIVWPRLFAAIIVMLILLEIWRDRRSKLARYVLTISLLALVISLVGLFVSNTISDDGKQISTAIIIAISLFLAQGYFHQISAIIKGKSTGALDIRMSQFILMMDLSTIAFALTMGLNNGWPLLVLAFTSATTKLIIMYLFKWVKKHDELSQRI